MRVFTVNKAFYKVGYMFQRRIPVLCVFRVNETFYKSISIAKKSLLCVCKKKVQGRLVTTVTLVGHRSDRPFTVDWPFNRNSLRGTCPLQLYAARECVGDRKINRGTIGPVLPYRTERQSRERGAVIRDKVINLCTHYVATWGASG